MGCFSVLIVLAAAVMTMVSLLRWWEQITDAVDQRVWNKIIFLLVFPPGVWFYPSRVSAGRPTAVPRHEPVRGFGTAPLKLPAESSTDTPPPGTPPEFIGPPKIPPKPKTAKPPVDADKLAKLRLKMRQQGMLPPENDAPE